MARSACSGRHAPVHGREDGSSRGTPVSRTRIPVASTPPRCMQLGSRVSERIDEHSRYERNSRYRFRDGELQ